MSYIAKLLLADIDGQLAKGDFDGVQVAVQSLAREIRTREATLEPDKVGGLLKALRRKRQFQALITVAEALDAGGVADTATRQLHGQALIDTGRLDEAVAHLERLLADLTAAGADTSTVRGNLGRVWKQRYVDAANATPSVRDAAALQAAIRQYGAVVARGNLAADHWHVINFIACTARAERDGIDPGHKVPSAEMARELIATLEPKAADPATSDIWLLASLGEAYVAIGDFTKAEAVYQRYSQSAGVDAFEIFSSMRQLIEVWQLKREGAGAAIVALLERRFGELMDKGTVLSGADVVRLERMDGLLGTHGAAENTTSERSRGGAMLIDFDYLARVVRRAKSVARILFRQDDEPIGAGFLVRGRELHPSFGDAICLLTNNHVISSKNGAGMAPAAVKLEFLSDTSEATEIACADAEILWESNVKALDATLVRIPQLTQGLEAQPLCNPQSLPDDIGRLAEELRFCHFIGPARDLKVRSTIEPSAICDLGWREADRKDHIFIHHDTETRDGSSGSPLFDIDWTVIGLHRAGVGASGRLSALGGRVGSYPARQAVSINSIRRQIAADLSGTQLPVSALRDASPEPKAVDLYQLITSETVDDETLDRYFVMDEEKSQPFAPVLKPRPAVDGTTAEKNMGGDAFSTTATALSVANRLRRNLNFKRKSPGERGLTLISDGDSWFQLPIPGLDDTIDHLLKTHAVYCHAIAGTELKDWAANAHIRILKSTAMYQPDGIVLSGGGNDLLGFSGLGNFISTFKAGEPAEAHIEPLLDSQLDVLIGFYARVIGDIVREYPKLKIFCHGYDYVLPTEPKGPWVYLPLSAGRRIKDIAMQRAIVKILIDRFNERMLKLETRFAGNVYFVDCRNAVGNTRMSWYDELHPRSPGFGRVAARFNRRIAEAFAGDRRVIGIA